jgi:hypothetical protein
MLHSLSDDDWVTLLREAKYFYDNHMLMESQQRLDSVKSLAAWDVFTIGQLSQLTGMSTTTLYKMVDTRGFGGGRFNPRSLDTLLQLRLNRNNGLPLSPVLLHTAVAENNSQRTIHKFTGIGQATISRRLHAYSDSGI